MANFTFDFPDVAKKLDELVKTDPAKISMAIKNACEILANELKIGYSAHVDTGDLMESISVREVSYKNYEVYINNNIGRNRIQNTSKAIWLEYGTNKQPATPVWYPVLRKNKQKLTDLIIKELTS